MSYIIPEKDLIFYKDKEGGIYSGGFSVNSIMMREGISPIITMNTINSNHEAEENNKVSDFFNDLVIPNWALAYTINDVAKESKYEYEYNRNNLNGYDHDDETHDIISDDLYNQLLGLVMVDEKILKGGKKNTKRHKLRITGKKTRKQR